MVCYQSYTHLERYDKSDCEGILEGPCAITAKIDGTNAVVWSDGKEIYAGSRKRQLSDQSDNAGFYQWIVNSNEEEAIKLRAFVLNNPYYMVYGEWMGTSKFVGAIKDYNTDALGHMYIFDVYDSNEGRYLFEYEWRPMLSSYELSPWFVALFGVYDGLTPEKLLEIAKSNKFLLNTANHPGEGVCIKRQDNWRNPWGHMVYGKLVLDEYKQDKSTPKKKSTASENIESDIADAYVTDAEIAKSIAKVCVLMNIDEFDKKNGQCIGRLINMVWLDLLDESKNWVKEFKNPTVSFAKLRRMSDTKVRNYLGF